MKKAALFALMLSLSMFAFGCTKTETDATNGAAPAPVENGDAAHTDAPAEEAPAEEAPAP